MKRLLLITPPYHAGVLESAGRWPNLAFVYLAGHARAAGYDVHVFDAMPKMASLEDIVTVMRDLRPDYVGITAVTAAYPAAVQVLAAAKQLDPAMTTIIGGIHTNFLWRECLESEPDVDVVVRGEGEETLPELLAALDSVDGLAEARRDGSARVALAAAALEQVAGISYRRHGEVVATPPRPFIRNLDDLIPAWDALDWNDYTFYVRPGSRLAIINTSRGCVNQCSFCSQQRFWHRTYRQRRPEAIIEEIELLRDRYGITVVMFSDEYPTRDRLRWERILDLLVQRRVGVEILLETCVEDILRDADLMDRYRQAGVRHVYVGVEAVSDERLDTFKKNIRCEQSRQALQLLNEAEIITECSFVLGMPDETWESIERTLELARYYKPDMPHFLTIAPWPYADLYPQLREHVVDFDYSHYNFVVPVVKPKAMTIPEVEQAIVQCYKGFYGDKMRQVQALPDGFKRDYMLRSFRVMMQNSFLHRLMAGTGAEHPQAALLDH
ncbi:MAG: B12-binding domain-containing radical SAM protein [Symbiobacteriia bacterium]